MKYLGIYKYNKWYFFLNIKVSHKAILNYKIVVCHIKNANELSYKYQVKIYYVHLRT